MRKLTFSKKRYLLILFFAIVILLAFIIPHRKKITISTVSPLPNTVSKTLTSPLIITFTRPLTYQEKNDINVQVNPPFEFIQQWTNNKSLTIKPKSILKEKTTYHVSVYFQSRPTYKWSFTTSSLNQLNPEETAAIQGFIDPAGQALEEAYEKRPWLRFFPIQTKNYSIDYLDSQKKIRVLMRIDITSPLSREEQIAQIKKEVPEKLKEIGVDLEKETVYYTFTP